jgi:ribokinase
VSRADGVFTRAGGGGVVAAVTLARLGAEVDFFCALGRDHNGDAAAAELRGRGVSLHVAWRDAPTRRIVTFLETSGPRTIITIGDRLEPTGAEELPWHRLANAGGVYFTAGDAAAATWARKSVVLTASPRARAGLQGSGVPIDAVVYSASDADESDWARRMEPQSRLMVMTEGARGGHWRGESDGRWCVAPLPGPPQDDYGCGDSFAAGFTFGLAQGLPVGQAAHIGAECGAYALTVPGAP